MIQRAEGTSVYLDPYKVLFGGGSFQDLSKHPNKRIPFYNPATGKQDISTAAGAYQINLPTYNWLKMKDFSKVSQDNAAIELLHKNGAYPYVIKGDLPNAIKKAAASWASLPGSTAKQKTIAFTVLKKYFDSMLSKVKNNPGTALLFAAAVFFLLNSRKFKI